VSKRANQSTISTAQIVDFLEVSFTLIYIIILQSMTWIEIKLCRDDKDLGFLQNPKVNFA